MNWLFPGLFAAAWAALLPLILHLLRRRRKRPAPFPSLQFLGLVSVVEQRQHRIRRWIVLLLRTAVFVLIAAAFARPFYPSQHTSGRRATIIVLDNSFSMQVAGRWESLCEWTMGFLTKTAPEESVGLLLMNPKPNWLVSPTRDVHSAIQALSHFQPGWHGTQAMAALRFAGDILSASSADERRIIMVSDQQASGWLNADFKTKLPAGIALLFPPDLPPLRSQAALWTPSLSREGEKLTVSLPVKTYTGAGNRTINLYAGAQLLPIASKTIQLVPGAVQTMVMTGTLPPSEKWIRCEMGNDDIAADDVVYSLVPDAETAQVVVLDSLPADTPTDYLATACESLAKVAPGWRVLPTSSPEWPPGAVLFLRNDLSFNGVAAQRLETFLNSGGSAIVFATGGPAQAQWLARHHAPIVACAGKARLHDWAIEHPLVAPLAEHSLRSLIGWRFSHGWTLPADAIEPLAFWDDGSPALGELLVGKGRLLIAGFMADRRDGNWPVEGSFLPFLHRSAQYFFDARVRAPEGSARVGVSLALPEGKAHWQAVAGPALREKPIDVQGYVTPAAPGVYEWNTGKGMPRLFAVGLSPEESDPTPLQGRPWQELVSSEKAPVRVHLQNIVQAAEESEHQQKLWWWCLVVVIICLILELGIANRTVR